MLSNLLALPLSSFILAPDSLAMLSPFLAFDFNPQSIPVVAIIGGLSLAAIIIVSGLFFQHRKRLMWHETARIALEKGQPLPPVPPTDEELDSRPPVGVSFAVGVPNVACAGP